MFRKIILIFLIIGILFAGIYIWFSYRPEEKNDISTNIKKEIPTIKSYELESIKLFFLLPNSYKLQTEKREIYKVDEIIDSAKQAILLLIEGPKTNLISTLSSKVKLRELFIKEDTAYIDFSATIKQEHCGGTFGEITTISSIVCTLLYNFPIIKKVQILVEGQEVDTLIHHIDTSCSFTLSEITKMIRCEDS